MKKLFAILLIAVVLVAATAQAQQAAKIPRIGYLTGDSISAMSPRRTAFREGLRELGYVEGKNIVVEWQGWEGKQNRQRALAAELVRLKVDVIVAVGSGDIRAANEATATIPIVMVQGGDAVGSGFVTSLARPGGNITGLATLRPELSGKRLELLKEIVPKLSRVAVFASSSSRDYAQIQKEIELAATALRVKVQYLEVQNPKDVETAFQAAVKRQADAILFRVGGPVLYPQRAQIAELAVKSRLPVIYERAEEVEGGGLMSYGLNTNDLYRRAATYVDKILK
jgi:putative ABC transport system substrate-binding protein